MNCVAMSLLRQSRYVMNGVSAVSYTHLDVYKRQVQRLFTFFFCSTYRCSVLKDFVNITLKGHCDTRQSSKADVVKPISSQLDEVIAALEKRRDTPTETTDTMEDAALTINATEKFNFVTCSFSGQIFFLLWTKSRKSCRPKE